MIQWLRRSFIAGFFVTVPLVVSIIALVWIIGIVDGFAAPLYERLLGRPPLPGLGLLTTTLAILLIGALASNVIGNKLLQRLESYLHRVPVFRSIYSPVKQLVVAFSPDNEAGFKRVVLIPDREGRNVLGFLTREFTLDRAGTAEAMVAVYVPTNHLYLGDVFVFARDRVLFPEITVEEGIRIFLTGGMALPSRVIERAAVARATAATTVVTERVRRSGTGGSRGRFPV